MPGGEGKIFVTGATAGMRGNPGYAAFAAAKSGLRAVAQSAARELWPQGLHVAHLVIDAGVDTAWVRERVPGRHPEEVGDDRPHELDDRRQVVVARGLEDAEEVLALVRGRGEAEGGERRDVGGG